MRKYINKVLQLWGYEIVRSVFRPYIPNPRHRIGPGPLDEMTVIEAPDPSDFSHSSNPLANYFFANSAGDLHKWFHYFDVYQRHFERFRDVVGLRVLEIGVSKGGSLKLWRHYFHPSALIVGVDIKPVCQQFEKIEDNVYVRIGSQQDDVFLRKLIEEFGRFDIIIDDGSHISEHQIATFEALYRDGLKDPGVYVVEDTHSNYWETARDAKKESDTFMGFAKEMIDRLHEPYQQFTSLRFFEADDRERIKRCSVSYFCAQTSTISFADSTVVFEKKSHAMPGTQTR